jgi:hypothetical protein
MVNRVFRDIKQLKEVFGVTSSIPQFTYVDRAQLDNKFRYYLTNEKHIVIHGASKQGKTVLRNKNLNPKSTIVIQCTSTSNLESIYSKILKELNVKTIKNYSESDISEAQGKLGIIGGGFRKNQTTHYSSIGNDLIDSSFISKQVLQNKKIVVVEDFHYLPEEEKRKFAFDLKAFWDNSVFFIIVGVWAEDNLLLYYNGDLSGRINEIDVKWTDQELDEVLTKGERALNIKFSNQIRNFLIRDSSQNVGLLQGIAEKLCFASGVFEYQQRPTTIANENSYANCRKSICDEEAIRYRQFSEVISRGFPNGRENRFYKHIIRVCIEHCADIELCNGIHRDLIFERIKKIESEISKQNVTNALKRLDKLQIDGHISPLVFSYNPDLQIVQLLDRKLLFYRKWGKPNWDWTE